MKIKNNKYIEIGIYSLLLFCVGLICIKRVIVAGDLDLWTTIAEANRISKGEIPFNSLWAPHGLSYLILAFAEKIWIYFSNSNEGIVFFSRTISFLVQIFICLFLCRTIKKYVRECTFLIGCIFMLYLSKKTMLVEYGNLTVWLLIIINCIYIKFRENQSRNWLFLLAVSCFLLVLTFPSYFLLLIVYIPLFLNIGETRKDKITIFSYVFVVCLSLSIALLLYLSRESGVNGVIQGLLKTYSSSGYNTSFISSMWTKIIKPIGKEGIHILPMCLIAGFACFIKNKRYVSKDAIPLFFAYVFALDIIEETFFCIIQQNEWHLRFIPLLVFIGLYYSAKEKNYPWISLIVVGVIGFVSTTILSTVSLTDAYRAMFPGALFSLIYLVHKRIKNFNLIICATLVYMLFCGAMFIRTTWGSSMLFDYSYTLVKEGPMKNIYMQDTEYDVYEKLIDISKEKFKADDVLAYFGTNNLIFLMGNIEVGMPTQLVNAWSADSADSFLSYYDCFPEKKPTIVILEKEVHFVPYESVFDSSKIINEGLLDWINKNYQISYEDDLYVIFR